MSIRFQNYVDSALPAGNGAPGSRPYSLTVSDGVSAVPDVTRIVFPGAIVSGQAGVASVTEPGGGGGAPYVSGAFYAPPVSVAAAIINGYPTAIPILIRTPVVIAGLSMTATDGTGTGAYIAFAIYASAGIGMGAKLGQVALGAVDFGAGAEIVGYFATPVAITTPGVYWLAQAASLAIGVWSAPGLNQYLPSPVFADVGTPSGLGQLVSFCPAYYCFTGSFAPPWDTMPEGSEFSGYQAGGANAPIVNFVVA